MTTDLQKTDIALTHDEVVRLKEMLRIQREREDYEIARKLVGRRAARRLHPDGALK